MKRLAVAALIAGALGSLGAGRATGVPHIDIVLRAFPHHDTLLDTPIDSACGVPVGKRWRPLTNDGIQGSVQGMEGDQGRLTVGVDAGFEGTVVLPFTGCRLSVTAAFDAPFPTHWTAPLPSEDEVAAMWAGEEEVAEPPPQPTRPSRAIGPLPALRLESDPVWARRTGSIPLPTRCLTDEHGLDAVPRDWATLDAPAVRIATHAPDRPTMRVRLPMAWKGSTELRVGACTLPVDVQYSQDDPTHPTEDALELSVSVRSSPEVIRGLSVLVPEVCAASPRAVAGLVEVLLLGKTARIAVDPGFEGHQAIELGRCSIEVRAEFHPEWTSHQAHDIRRVHGGYSPSHVPVADIDR